MMAVTKKRDARKSLRQPAWITLEGGFAARQCMVQDISTSGAKITVDDPDIAAREIAAGVVARCANGTKLRGGLAPRRSSLASSSGPAPADARAKKAASTKHPPPCPASAPTQQKSPPRAK